MTASDQAVDRVFTFTFAISALAHGLLLAAQLLPGHRTHRLGIAQPFEVVYDYDIADRDVRGQEQRAAAAAREVIAVSSPAGGGAAGMPLLSLAAGDGPHVRIPERSVGGGVAASLLEAPVGRSAVVDLTNLAEAAGGNPVLLTYFSAVREQIQQAANRRPWVSDDSQQGLVYVSFVLFADGSVERLGVLGERSATSIALRDIALRIVRAAAPFPSFPPSMVEATKTVVVPLQFLEGS